MASTHAYLMPITTRGKLYWLKVHEIPPAGRSGARQGHRQPGAVRARTRSWPQVLVTKDFAENQFVFFVTRRGVVKRTDLTAFSNVRSSGIIALGIEDGDALVAVKITDGTKDILLSTRRA